MQHQMLRTENTGEHITDDFHWDYSFISTPTTLDGSGVGKAIVEDVRQTCNEIWGTTI
jgi:hypothetical protein